MHGHLSGPQRAPHKWTVSAYGQTRQFAKTHPSLPILNDELTNIIQQRIGLILYYGRAIDYTMLPALTEIAHIQAKPSVYMQDEMSMLMDYCATHHSSVIRVARQCYDPPCGHRCCIPSHTWHKEQNHGLLLSILRPI